MYNVFLLQCGWTAAHFAANSGHLEMLQELLERHNCEPDKKDKVNRVIILIAKRFDSVVPISLICIV